MTAARYCAQCGTVFTPRREHARFCSGGCRAGWARQRNGDPAARGSAIRWSAAAMHDTVSRLPGIAPDDWPGALAVIAEAVWQVTMVDAVLVRYHPEAYDSVLGRHPPAERLRVDGTLGGLRYVRNRMRSGNGAPTAAPPGKDGEPVTAWAWQAAPVPALGPLTASGREWELARYRAYRDFLAGHALGETFGRAAGFLSLAAATIAGGAGYDPPWLQDGGAAVPADEHEQAAPPRLRDGPHR
jgi:hypothetical protein